jgi:hypothetical protein
MNGLVRRIGRAVSDACNDNPVVRAAKNLRNEAIDRVYRRRRQDDGATFAAELERRGVHRLCVAVAFNSPWVIDVLTAAWELHPVGMALAVVDNSSRPAARAEHQRICATRGVPWLGLPANPEWSPNRSHGITLNWIWHNVVRRLRPELVGFVDHDCFPIRPFDLPSRMNGVTVYGLRKASWKYPEPWNVWAGYTFLRPAAIEAAEETFPARIDFKHRIEYGLDTGGSNWLAIYRKLDSARIGSATEGILPVDLGGGRPPLRVQLIDDTFAHLGGASYDARFGDGDFRGRLLDAVGSGPLHGGRRLVAAA